MPEPLLLAHLLTLVAVLDALVGLGLFFRWQANEGAGRGTPRYARARDSRRAAVMTGASALVFLLLAWATPLGQVRIG